MALQDDAQDTWDKAKEGFGERIGSDENTEASEELSPEDREQMGEDMTTFEDDNAQEEDATREYSDEDRA